MSSKNPNIDITYIDGERTEVERLQPINRFLSPSASDVEVTLTQVTDPATQRWIINPTYQRYQVTNTLDETLDFSLKVRPREDTT